MAFTSRSVTRRKAQAQTTTPEVNAWVVIKPDDTVVIRIARSEMGQGTRTGLAQLVAEELQCDWSKVTTEYPTPGQNVARNRVWQNFSTGGSRGIRESNEYVRKGGAAARIMLIQAAANDWNVPASECRAENSVITHQPSGRTTTYGKVADAASKLEAPKDVPLKAAKDWTIAGKPLKRLDTAPKTNGTQVYGLDIKLPGMLVASIKETPLLNGKVKSFDASKAEGKPGVRKVVQVGDNAVAVIGDTFYQTKTALAGMPIEWDGGDNVKVSSDTIAAMLREGLGAEQAFVGNKAGDAKAALASAAKRVEAVYSYPFQAHATMEPMNATALYTPDRCQVWCPTQNGEAALAVCAEAAELPVAKCDVYKYDLGGGFGRRGMSDYVRQAVLVAKQMPGTPIKLIWSREDDMTHDFYHPISQCKLSAGFDTAGNLTALHMRISSQSIMAYVFPQNLQNGMDPAVFQGLTPSSPEGHFGYTVPNLLIDHAMRNTPVRPGFWRGVNTNQNAVYVECFMDELAHASRPGSAGLPAEAAGGPPEASCRAQCRGRARRLGQTRTGRHLSWPRAIHGLWQLRGRGGGSLGQQGPAQSAPYRRRDQQRPCREPGADRAAGRRLVRLWLCRPPSMANAPSRTAACSRRTSTPTRSCALTRCRRSRRS